jgi:hypothetical protein
MLHFLELQMCSFGRQVYGLIEDYCILMVLGSVRQAVKPI